jgi:hypothetical protein
MKVYTKIVYDKDDNIIEEHSYNYNGHVSLCEEGNDDEKRDADFIKKRDIKKFKKSSMDDAGLDVAWSFTGARTGEQHIPRARFSSNNAGKNYGPWSKGKIYNNILHKFASYSTIFTLSGLSEQELRTQAYLSNSPHEIIARTGGIGDANVSTTTGTEGPTKKYTKNNPYTYESQVELLERKARAEFLTGEKRVAGTDYDESKYFLEAGRDIFFENVNILSTTGPNAERGLSNFQRMEFELHEPFGISFVEKMRAAAFINGYLDFHSAPYLLTIQWKGWDEHGKERKDSSLIRKIPIRIVRVEFDVDAGGAKYQCLAVAAESIAFDDRFKYPHRQINITASNWLTWKKEIEKQLDEQMAVEIKEGVRQYKDVFKFEVSPEVLKYANMLGAGVEGGIHQSNDGTTSSIDQTMAPDSNKPDAQITIDGKAWDLLSELQKHEQKLKAQAKKRAEEKTSSMETTNTIIDSYTSMVKLFEDAIRSGFGYTKLVNNYWYELGRKLLNDSAGENQKTISSEASKEEMKQIVDFMGSPKFAQALGKEENQYVDWFMIKPKFEVLGPMDDIRKVQPKIITFVAIETKIHILKFIKAGISFGNIDWSAYIRKKYDYIYTGENVDIQHLKIHYKTAYYMRNTRPFATEEKHGGAVHDFTNSLKETLNKVFGAENYPEPYAQLRMEPSINLGKSTVVSNDPRSRKNQEFYDYLTNPQADMINIELTILGDPAFLCQDQFTNLKKDNTKDKSNIGPWNDTYNSFNSESVTPLIVLNYRLPEDFNDKTGEYFEADVANRTMWFSGIYQVVKVDSKIEQGSFTQVLYCVRLNNQKGDGTTPIIGDQFKKYFKKVDAENAEENLPSKTGFSTAELNAVTFDVDAFNKTRDAKIKARKLKDSLIK